MTDYIYSKLFPGVALNPTILVYYGSLFTIRV